MVFTLFGRTYNVIYWNSDEAHVFCSSLSFQQAPVNICMSNRSRATAGFVKTVSKNERCKEMKEIRGALRRVHICTQMRRRHAGPRRMPTNAKKLLVQCLPHKRTSKYSTDYSLAVLMNVHPHQYNGEHIFLWSTDSRWTAFTCSPNIRRISEWKRMLFAYTSILRVLRAFSYLFCIRVQMWTLL